MQRHNEDVKRIPNAHINLIAGKKRNEDESRRCYRAMDAFWRRDGTPATLTNFKFDTVFYANIYYIGNVKRRRSI